MSNSNLGHVLCPFTDELAIVRANKKGKLYYVSGAGMITPACQRGQAWIKEKAKMWAEPDRPPEGIRLEYDHDSRAPKPVYVNEAPAPEAPKPEPENPEPAPEQKPKSRSIISRIWEGVKMFDQEAEAPEQPEAGTVNEAETEAQEWAQLEGMAAGVTTGTDLAVPGQLADPEISTAEMLYPLLTAGFSILAPNWEVTDDEVQALSSSYGQAMDAVFPEINIDPRVAAVLGAVTTTGLIIGPRWHKPRVEKEVNKAPQKPQAKPAQPAEPEPQPKPVNIKLD